MVLKQRCSAVTIVRAFESNVILYGIKTNAIWFDSEDEFESNVILYGIKTQ